MNGIAKAAAPRDHVMAKRSFFLRSDAQNCFPGAAVEGVCLKFHPQAIPGFEGVTEHEVFGFGVDDSALPGLADESRSDLDALVADVDVHEARAAHGFSGGDVGGRERQVGACGLRSQCRGDVSTHLFRRCDAIRDQCPEIFFEADFAQAGMMLLAERFEADGASFERHRFDEHGVECS